MQGNQEAGDRITTGDIEGVGVAIGAGASVVIHGDVHYYPIRLGAPLRSVFEPLIAGHVRRFGGRAAILDRIARFLHEPGGGYLVVTAPAGFGKTALMAALVGATPEAFAYHFFTPLYGAASLTEGFFLRNVVEQLAQWHGFTDLLPDEGQLNELRALYQRFVDAPLERTRVLVLDGLDEITGWSLRPYVCLPLPTGMHILLTVRDTGQDWAAEYDLPADQVHALPIGGLLREDVVEVIHAVGGLATALAEDDAAIQRLLEVAEYEADPALGADPLYVRVLAEDIADGDLRPDQTGKQPPGLEGYLQRWWVQFAQTTDREPVADLLSTLTVALGPMPQKDLETLNPSLTHRVRRNYLDEVVGLVRRWVVTTPHGYALAHPRLRHYLHNELRTEPYLERLLVHCAGWQQHRSPYGLRYYARHLYEAGQERRLYALIDRPWMETKLAVTLSHRAFADDVALAKNVAAAEEPPNLAEVIRCSLILATVGSLATRVPPEALGLLALAGKATRALDLAALINDTGARSEAYTRIIEALLARHEIASHPGLLPAALQAAGRVGNWEKRASHLVCVAQAFAAVGEIEKAVGVVDQAQVSLNHGGTTKAPGLLRRLSRILAEVGQASRAEAVAERALQMAEGYRGQWVDNVVVESLAEAACAFAHLEQGERADQTLSHALTMAAAQPNPVDQTEARLNVAQVLANSGDFDRAVAITMGVVHEWPKTVTLGHIARTLSQKGDHPRAVELADRVVASAGVIGYELQRLTAIAEAAQVFASAGAGAHARAVLDMALPTSNALPPAESVQALCSIVSPLAQVGNREQAQAIVEQALATAEAVDDESDRITALLRLAETLIEIGSREQAVSVLNRTIVLAEVTPDSEEASERVQTLCEVAVALAQSGQTSQAVDTAQQALLASLQIYDEEAAMKVRKRMQEAFERGSLVYAWRGVPDVEVISARTGQVAVFEVGQV